MVHWLSGRVGEGSKWGSIANSLMASCIHFSTPGWRGRGGGISSRCRCPLCELYTLWCSIKSNLTALFPPSFFLLLRLPLKEGGQRGTEREEYIKGRAGEGKVTIETVRLRSKFPQVNGSFFKSILLCLCALWFRRGSFDSPRVELPQHVRATRASRVYEVVLPDGEEPGNREFSR